ncbi:hypothetical protein GQ43DRAFT_444698 [Delitschia confertaspora ATCC 74209]|uniref:Mtf2-like C-terminal domain-containing protein n=1 Tax=Delitschia confertaspora ATCC 74209 TaxID=1513339 RepID=A0A9P4JCG2_9PLEO|nr:hypothetical protein GQ43DRAFT_444698 [Delitschia confertaspora ATCC 74209]
MSLSNSTFRALSHQSKVSPSPKTFLPFLYQTPTIQRWNNRQLSRQRRHASTRRFDNNDIPFEGIPSNLGAPGPRKTTLTATEREAFEKLRRDATRQSTTSDSLHNALDLEPDDDPNVTLDSLFDAVLAGRPPGSAGSAGKVQKKTDNLTTLAQSILEPELERAKKQSKKEAEEKAQKIRVIREAERMRVDNLLEHAQTDVELWKILENEVFALIGQLNLDNAITKTPNSEEFGSSVEDTATITTATETDASSSQSEVGETNKTPDPSILFPNFPHHILHAARLLRVVYPASALPLSVLPTLKSLGRAAYMLGASTPLYNMLLRTIWIQYGSYDAMNELLTDMDNGGIEFDLKTLKIVEDVLAESEAARKNAYGAFMRKVWATERFGEGAKTLEEWKDVILQRLGRWAETRTSTGSVSRNIDSEWTPGRETRREVQRPRGYKGLRKEECGVSKRGVEVREACGKNGFTTKDVIVHTLQRNGGSWESTPVILRKLDPEWRPKEEAKLEAQDVVRDGGAEKDDSGKGSVEKENAEDSLSSLERLEREASKSS